MQEGRAQVASSASVGRVASALAAAREPVWRPGASKPREVLRSAVGSPWRLGASKPREVLRSAVGSAPAMEVWERAAEVRAGPRAVPEWVRVAQERPARPEWAAYSSSTRRVAPVGSDPIAKAACVKRGAAYTRRATTDGKMGSKQTSTAAAVVHPAITRCTVTTPRTAPVVSATIAGTACLLVSAPARTGSRTATRPAWTWAAGVAKVPSAIALAMRTAVATPFAPTVPASPIARTASTMATSPMSTAEGPSVRPVLWADSVDGTKIVPPEPAMSSWLEIGTVGETWVAAPRRPRVVAVPGAWGRIKPGPLGLLASRTLPARAAGRRGPLEVGPRRPAILGPVVVHPTPPATSLAQTQTRLVRQNVTPKAPARSIAPRTIVRLPAMRQRA
jgi:hypothetical protein